MRDSSSITHGGAGFGGVDALVHHFNHLLADLHLDVAEPADDLGPPSRAADLELDVRASAAGDLDHDREGDGGAGREEQMRDKARLETARSAGDCHIEEELRRDGDVELAGRSSTMVATGSLSVPVATTDAAPPGRLS